MEEEKEEVVVVVVVVEVEVVVEKSGSQWIRDCWSRENLWRQINQCPQLRLVIHF